MTATAQGGTVGWMSLSTFEAWHVGCVEAARAVGAVPADVEPVTADGLAHGFPVECAVCHTVLSG